MKTKTILIIFLFCSLVSACASNSTPEPYQTQVIAPALAVYDCPDLTCMIVGQVKKGDRIWILDEDVDGWTAMKYFGATRYVFSSGLR